MQIIKLSEEQIKNVYFNYLVHDFHEAEVKSWEHIKQLLDKNNYLCLGLFDKLNTLFSYAFFCISENSDWLFLDYYAVLSDYRGKGYGSIFIELLKTYDRDKKGILAEVENPDFSENEKEKNICTRRIEFYCKNHWYLSQVYTCVFGVNYQIMQLPFCNPIDDTTIYQEIETIYRTMFSENIYEKEVQIKLI